MLIKCSLFEFYNTICVSSMFTCPYVHLDIPVMALLVCWVGEYSPPQHKAQDFSLLNGLKSNLMSASPPQFLIIQQCCAYPPQSLIIQQCCAYPPQFLIIQQCCACPPQFLIIQLCCACPPPLLIIVSMLDEDLNPFQLQECNSRCFVRLSVLLFSLLLV